jgi:excisionase family DNA binding protein
VQKYMNKKEAAELLGVCPRTLERYLMSGRLRAARLDKGWRIAESDIEAFLEAEKEATQASLKGKAGSRPKPGFNGTRNKTTKKNAVGA